MSEAEEQRPLTRRERRIREFGETGALPLLNTDGTSAITNPPPSEEFIDVDPFDEHGNPRSRREIRELREKLRIERAALQVREAERAQKDVDAAAEDREHAQVREDDSPAQSAPASVHDEIVLESAPEAAAETVTEVLPDTEAIPFDEVIRMGAEQADQPVTSERSEAAEPSIFDTPEPTEDSTAVDSTPEETNVSGSDGVGETSAELESEIEAGGESSFESEDAISSNDDTEAELGGVTAETPDAPATPEDLAETAAPRIDGADRAEVTATANAAETETEPEPVQARRSTYTFPDITPLDDEVSVFDDPAVRTISGQSQNEPAFDDLISRAVAQEGAVSSTNTSALILPSMPDTGNLSGPLGETGELFITGSIDLPRSFSETGGHASLIDSVDADHVENFGAADQDPRESGLSPVSATRAVSARVIPGPVVTEAQKEKSKLPTVLIATGGGLVVVVAGLLIWGATSGMFG